MIWLWLLAIVGCTTLPNSYHPSDPIVAGQFSHELFDQTLGEHVHHGVVNYPGYASDPRLNQYIHQLNRLDPTTLPTRNDRLAFWINAYNAFAIQGILDGYSPKTWAGKYKYFVSRDYMVGGAKVNLYAVERAILIPEFREPRIHFAIVCASRSCPTLRSWAFTPDRLDQQLDDSARLFINDPDRNAFDRRQKIAYLSKIFDWFTDDFVSHSGSLTKYVAQYVEDPKLARELAQDTYQVEFLEYDWNLNGIPPTTTASSKFQVE
ncbi:MAG: DUF547 domain-containing protein [Nitrospirota bacterium]|nr:MAG: DUF547 domain-containing protein [Nitrospirota bacterium]